MLNNWLFLKILAIFNHVVLKDLGMSIKRDLCSKFTLPTFCAKEEILLHNPIICATSFINYYFNFIVFVYFVFNFNIFIFLVFLSLSF